MEKIRLLDCTLRDGGYINDWNFGARTIRNLLARLVDAKTDLIEVGFLRNCTYDPNRTLFNNVAELKSLLPDNRKKSRFASYGSPQSVTMWRSWKKMTERWTSSG